MDFPSRLHETIADMARNYVGEAPCCTADDYPLLLEDRAEIVFTRRHGAACLMGAGGTEIVMLRLRLDPMGGEE